MVSEHDKAASEPKSHAHTRAKITPVVISGGAGSRLWPLSRGARPKQFLDLSVPGGDGEGSGAKNGDGNARPLLARTLERSAALDDVGAPIIVANDDHRFLVAESARIAGLEPAAILLEPVGRNTAPAIAAAAVIAERDDPDALLLVQPSDHLITKPDAYREAIAAARAGAEAGYLMTFGITPDRPETGYGWIEGGAPIDAAPGCRAVVAFHEKPDLPKAEGFLASGRHTWNAGIFLIRARDLLLALERFEPKILEAVREAVDTASVDRDFTRLERAAFERAPSLPIDIAVMERSDRVGTVPVEMGWTDIGGFDALYGLGERDARGNVHVGAVVSVDSDRCHVRAESGRLVAMVDVADLTVIETDDAVMIAPRGRTEAVKRLVEALKSAGRPEVDVASRVYRPWGWYQSVDRGERFQVKRISVDPGASLSLQKHKHRAEHWVVVRGTARVTIDDRVAILQENESTFIPLGAKHRLENPGEAPLEMIEVQSGSYLGEDDIVRFSDDYGRT